MQMSYGEILRAYKEAKGPKKQLGILAELNAVPKSEIAKILYEAGAINKMTCGQYQRQSRKRDAAPAESAAAAAEKVQTPAEAPSDAQAPPVPEAVLEMVRGTLAGMRSAYERAREVVRQYEELEAFLAAAERKTE